SDRLFRVGRGDRAPPPADPAESQALQAHRLVDLILTHAPQARFPSGSAAWMDALSPARLFHIRDGDGADIQRLARLITNRAVGVVFSGGGARAYAHIGAIKALREAGEPIDFLGGASMGAVIAAGVAKGWDDEELEARVRKAFVETSPLDDIALPLLAMTQGLKVSQRLEEHFGDTDIADLWRPFFCVSSNLTSGTYQVHQKGSLRQALRASISLPGVMPPATDGPNVLVDGAVMKNFPADLMRAVQTGPILGVDVTRGRSITAAEVARPSSVWKWIWSGEWRKGPPIVSLLMRAATVSSGRDLAASREATDVLVLPDLTGVEIRDWKAFEPAVEAGYRATKAALEALDRPLTDLRRRPHLADLYVTSG
ncbi:MAG TPA: patatin-like phospholipase family protein, partial [Phenylobacterium sp.]|nr:patatin-like phospholipase family protein [Phenylobacterium sp.]